MAVRRRHGPSVSRVRRGHAHVLLGSGHAGVSQGPREHAQSRAGSKRTGVSFRFSTARVARRRRTRVKTSRGEVRHENVDDARFG